MGINIKPLSPALGAEITGVDFRQPIDIKTKETLNKIWLEFHLLVIPSQTINDNEHIRFCELFGSIQPERLNSHLADRKSPGIHFVSNIRADGILPHGDIVFHMDQIQYEKPSRAMSLYGISVPLQGGETKFSNCHLVYDSLPDKLKKRLDGLRARNSLATPDGQSYLSFSSNKSRKIKKKHGNSSFSIHPVVRTHPITKRKTIYVNRLLTDRIIDIDDQESDTLLNMIYNTIEEKRFVYEHKWRVGDILFWDNCCLMHARNSYDSSNDHRLLRRIAVVGDKPY